jgi:hypothetical protein
VIDNMSFIHPVATPKEWHGRCFLIHRNKRGNENGETL